MENIIFILKLSAGKEQIELERIHWIRFLYKPNHFQHTFVVKNYLIRNEDKISKEADRSKKKGFSFC